MPLPPAWRRDTTGVQGVRNVPQSSCPRFLRLSNDGQDVRCVSVGLSLHSLYRATAGYVELRVTQGGATGLCCREGLSGSGADQCALFLCKGGKEVQHERVHVWPKLCDQERHLVRHEPADEMNVAAKAVQFRDGYLTPLLPCGRQSRLQLGPAIHRVRALAGLHLNELAVDLEPLGLGKVVEGNPLGLNAQARSALLRRRNPNVRDDCLICHDRSSLEFDLCKNYTSAINFANFDFHHAIDKVDDQLAAVLNATSTDLGEFREHGGKLLMYHGWADPLIPPQSSINYFNALVGNGKGGVQQASFGGNGNPQLQRTQSYARLFMVPGMYHCSGGPGPNVFDALTPLVTWVETGTAPETIAATKFVDDTPPAVQMTRPLCVFPKVAKYTGSGSTNIAANFTCVTDEHDFNQTPAPKYGP